MFGLPGGSEWILLVLMVRCCSARRVCQGSRGAMGGAEDEFNKANNTPSAVRRPSQSREGGADGDSSSLTP